MAPFHSTFHSLWCASTTTALFLFSSGLPRGCWGFAPPVGWSSSALQGGCCNGLPATTTSTQILALPKEGTLEVFRTYTADTDGENSQEQVTEAFNIVRLLSFKKKILLVSIISY